MIVYLDASAWAKRYFREAGSAIVEQVFASDDELVSSVLGHVEVSGVIARASSASQASELVAADLSGIELIETTQAIGLMAANIAGTRKLRGADAVHVATALAVEAIRDERLLFITSDQEMVEAARELGFNVVDPTENAGAPGDR